MVEVLESDYVEMARLRLPERTVLIRHALPNAIGPVFQVIAITWPIWPAASSWSNLSSITPVLQCASGCVVDHDPPVVQALAMLIAGVYVVLILSLTSRLSLSLRD